MRILYGAFAMGHGHFSKAAVLVPLMEARGHEVRLVSSGAEDPPPGYDFRWHRHMPGLAYVTSEGRTDYVKSFLKWLRESPRMLAHAWRLRRIAADFQPDLVVSDFEPLTTNPLVNPGCEVVALSRQVALCDRAVPLPEEADFERKMTRSVTRLFSMGADRTLGYHYEPASFRCVPPVTRTEIRDIVPTVGEHVLVYHSVGGDGDAAGELVAWAERTRTPVRAYGYPEQPRGRAGRVDFRPPSREGLLADLASSRAVMCTAGLSTPIEAFLLRKPLAVVPIPGHYEQLVNAFHLERAGIATWCRTWDYDAMLETPPPPADHPLRSWLETPAERVLDLVLDETTPLEEVPGRRAA